jgi:hypothetical protein
MAVLGAPDPSHFAVLLTLQMVWIETTSIGCAIANCSSNTQVDCKYSPAGNVFIASANLTVAYSMFVQNVKPPIRTQTHPSNTLASALLLATECCDMQAYHDSVQF